MTVALLAKPNLSASLGLRLDTDNVLTLIQFDASITEVYNRRKEITKHPVEAGADIGDHSRILPTTIEINGWVSDDPIIFLRSQRATASVPGGNPDTRAADAWRELNRIMEEEDLITVVGDLDEFDNMTLTGIRVPKDKDKGRVLDATLTFEQLTIATTETVAAPEPVQSNRAPKTQEGNKPSRPPKPVPEETQTSVIFDVIQGTQ